jgi:sigma-E factor negative regulatory protein RseC
MLEETARVVQVDSGGVWVETQRRSTCSSCAAEQGCGTATLAKVLGTRRTRMRVLSSTPLRIGDRVVIGINESALLRGSVAVYAVPLLMLLAGAVAGELGAQQGLWRSAELASVLLGVGGLLAGLWWLQRFTGRIKEDHNYQPVVLRREVEIDAGTIVIRE